MARMSTGQVDVRRSRSRRGYGSPAWDRASVVSPWSATGSARSTSTATSATRAIERAGICSRQASPEERRVPPRDGRGRCRDRAQ